MDEIAAKHGYAIDLVKRILSAFTISTDERNPEFRTLQDFNIATAKPFLRTPDGELVLLQSYSFAEAIYDAPFYWMALDKDYLPVHSKNRGDFTENFVAERLRLVFGPDHVYLNVNIIESNNNRVSEIDVLVIWGNRIIITQAKSKRLTLGARKGNDQMIRDDFKHAVQAAYEQGAICAKCLLDKSYKVATPDGNDIKLPQKIKEVYLFCVVSDHYPALSFQSRQFLQVVNIDQVQAPLVMDVFAIDAMTEMLQSPLQFLSYLNRRANYSDKIMASLELVILGYHLKYNLWLDPEYDFVQLGDDFSTALDIAMMARRNNIKGVDTPDGVLTRCRNTTIGQVIKQIEARPEPATIDLGFMLLRMSEQAIIDLSRVVNHLAARTRADGKVHDASFSFKEDSGITFHCTDEPVYNAGPRLEAYCNLRKYREKAREWFGLCMSSKGPKVRFGVSLVYPWAHDAEMDVRSKSMQSPMPIDQGLRAIRTSRCRRKKIGRNDPCPCGSGRKYKKCCLN